MRAAVIGAGITGARVVRELATTDGVTSVGVETRSPGRVDELRASFGSVVTPLLPDDDVSFVVIATPPGDHDRVARRWLERGASVVSVSPSVVDAAALFELDEAARAGGRFVACGVGFEPGLSTLLVAWAAARLDLVHDVDVAFVGAGGPACAEWLSGALSDVGTEWVNGARVERRRGEGVELSWFPDPIGPLDCFVIATAGPELARPGIESVRRFAVRATLAAKPVGVVRTALGISSRVLGRQHRNLGDDPGALRVEVAGEVEGNARSIVLGVVDRPAAATAATAVVVGLAAARSRSVGCGGAADLVDVDAALVELARRGVKVAVHDPER